MRRFVTGPFALTLDLTAKRYGQRPSSLIGLPPEDPVALNFDLAILTRGLQEELRVQESTQESDPTAPPPGAIDAERITTVMHR